MSQARRHLSALAILASVLTLGAALWAGEDFVIGAAAVKPGTAASGYLAVPAGKDGAATVIPYTVIHGVKPGPVLALIAGIHAYEYPPILASYRLKSMVDPGSLRGTLILVHIANMPSFKKRTLYFVPEDWKNLNRVFPGDREGTMSQRIAAVLNDEVIGRASAVIDMHCGDGCEALIPYTYWMISGHEDLDARTRELALAFGLPHIIIDDTRGHDLRTSKYCGNTALLRGKLAITTEAGYLGRTDEESVDLNVRGALSVMRHLGLLEGRPEPVAEPVWIDRYEVVNSKWSGVWTPRVSMGAFVRGGEIVGTVRDYLGEWKEDVRAPFTGILLYIVGTPPCNEGEPLFEVGRVQEK
jgi:predicted deacylase